MTKLRAHFDGKVLVPEEPVDLPMDCALEVQVQPVGILSPEDKPLLTLARLLEQLPDNPDWPADGAAQHEHYLFGLPKQP
jgi:hypothetical protein